MDFWEEYEEKIGEKVTARCLGQYVSGWDEFGPMRNPLWGLIIATSSGFRFHHFPQAHWFNSLFNRGKENAQKEKTIYIPRENIISSALHKETKWYKKIFSNNSPRLIICYRDEAGTEKELLFWAEYKPEGIAEAVLGE
jgi:hypothetical protein